MGWPLWSCFDSKVMTSFTKRGGFFRLPQIIRERTEPGDEIVIEVLGLCTDICVVSNALLLKAHFPEAKIAVNARCCAGVTPQKHQAALEVMQSCQIDLA